MDSSLRGITQPPNLSYRFISNVIYNLVTSFSVIYTLLHSETLFFHFFFFNRKKGILIELPLRIKRHRLLFSYSKRDLISVLQQIIKFFSSIISMYAEFLIIRILFIIFIVLKINKMRIKVKYRVALLYRRANSLREYCLQK